MSQDYIVVAYLRKSQDDRKRQVQSMPKQRDWAKEIAEQNGEEIEYFFKDEKTAKEPGREGFAEMLKFIYAAKKPIKLYAWRTSRLSRNAIDEGSIKYAISTGKIKYVITKDKHYDESTSHILLGVDFGEASQFSASLSLDVKEAMKRKVKRGYYPHLAPNGWLNDPATEQGDRKIFVDPKRFPILQKEIYKMLDSKGAYRVADSVRYLHSIDFRTKKGALPAKSTLHGFYTHPFICGQYEWNGEWHVGKHKPMITPMEFENLQIYITGQRSSQRKHTNIYNGIIRCEECNCWVTTEPPKIKKQKNGNIHIYNYMRCTKNKGKCSQKCIRMEKIEKQIYSTLSSMEVDQKFVSFCIKALHREAKDNSKDCTKQREHIQKLYNENDQKISRITDKYSQGKIDDDIYTETIAQYKKTRFRLEAQIQDYGKQRDLFLEGFCKDLEFAKHISNLFLNGSITEKKDIMRNLQSNLWLINGNLFIDLKSSFLVLSQFNRLKSVIEPRKASLGEVIVSIPSVWCAMSDVIRTHLKLRECYSNMIENYFPEIRKN